MENNYLIPANSKKSMLILGLFTMPDLIIFGTGVVISFILMLTIQTNDVKTALLIIAPALICSFLVIPVPNQHNVITFIRNVYAYFTRRRTYFWKGWCNSYDEDSNK